MKIYQAELYCYTENRPSLRAHTKLYLEGQLQYI